MTRRTGIPEFLGRMPGGRDDRLRRVLKALADEVERQGKEALERDPTLMKTPQGMGVNTDEVVGRIVGRGLRVAAGALEVRRLDYVPDLTQTISATPTQGEVQLIQDTLNTLLQAIRRVDHMERP